jgi:hypothetical protein
MSSIPSSPYYTVSRVRVEKTYHIFVLLIVVPVFFLFHATVQSIISRNP